MKIASVTVALFALLALGGVVSAAPSCIYIHKSLGAQIESEFRDAKLVFSGEVVRISKIPDKEFPKPLEELSENDLTEALYGLNRISVTVRAEKFWKGEPAEFIDVLTTGASATSSGAPFQLGEKYLLFANDRKGELVVDECTLTRRLANSSDVLHALGEGKIPSRGKAPH